MKGALTRAPAQRALSRRSCIGPKPALPSQVACPLKTDLTLQLIAHDHTEVRIFQYKHRAKIMLTPVIVALDGEFLRVIAVALSYRPKRYVN